MNVANKTILITGANRGIGRALLDEALGRGAKKVYAGTRVALQHPDKRVTPLALDVTSSSQIRRAVAEVDALDILINNAGVALPDDLSKPDVIQQQLAVNLLGPLNVTHAFLPLLKRSGGAIVNNLSLAALAALPVVPGYSISKAAASSMTQSLRALVAGQGVSVHAVFLGPVDTDMSRGFEVAKSSPETAARGILDGLESGDEDIFPDPASQPMAEGWRNGVAKGLERQFAAFIPATEKKEFAITFLVDLTPQEAFAAINDVRGWWSGTIEGNTDTLGAEFTYRHNSEHRSRQRITALEPGKRVVWHVVDSHLDFVERKSEWNGTDIVFELSERGGKTEVRFAHKGLVPAFECYDSCSSAWGALINGNLRRLMVTGEPQPDPFALIGE